MRYRKKPLTVEAVQFLGRGDNEYLWSEEPAWLHEAFERGDLEITWGARVQMTTIHGDDAWADPGDWIVREPETGHFYPIRRDVFAATYEPVEEPTNA